MAPSSPAKLQRQRSARRHRHERERIERKRDAPKLALSYFILSSNLVAMCELRSWKSIVTDCDSSRSTAEMNPIMLNAASEATRVSYRVGGWTRRRSERRRTEVPPLLPPRRRSRLERRLPSLHAVRPARTRRRPRPLEARQPISPTVHARHRQVVLERVALVSAVDVARIELAVESVAEVVLEPVVADVEVAELVVRRLVLAEQGALLVAVVAAGVRARRRRRRVAAPAPAVLRRRLLGGRVLGRERCARVRRRGKVGRDRVLPARKLALVVDVGERVGRRRRVEGEARDEAVRVRRAADDLAVLDRPDEQVAVERGRGEVQAVGGESEGRHALYENKESALAQGRTARQRKGDGPRRLLSARSCPSSARSRARRRRCLRER